MNIIQNYTRCYAQNINSPWFKQSTQSDLSPHNIKNKIIEFIIIAISYKNELKDSLDRNTKITHVTRTRKAEIFLPIFFKM